MYRASQELSIPSTPISNMNTQENADDQTPLSSPMTNDEDVTPQSVPVVKLTKAQRRKAKRKKKKGEKRAKRYAALMEALSIKDEETKKQRNKKKNKKNSTRGGTRMGEQFDRSNMYHTQELEYEKMADYVKVLQVKGQENLHRHDICRFLTTMHQSGSTTEFAEALEFKYAGGDLIEGSVARIYMMPSVLHTDGKTQQFLAMGGGVVARLPVTNAYQAHEKFAHEDVDIKTHPTIFTGANINLAIDSMLSLYHAEINRIETNPTSQGIMMDNKCHPIHFTFFILDGNETGHVDAILNHKGDGKFQFSRIVTNLTTTECAYFDCKREYHNDPPSFKQIICPNCFYSTYCSEECHKNHTLHETNPHSLYECPFINDIFGGPPVVYNPDAPQTKSAESKK